MIVSTNPVHKKSHHVMAVCGELFCEVKGSPLELRASCSPFSFYTFEAPGGKLTTSRSQLVAKLSCDPGLWLPLHSQTRFLGLRFHICRALRTSFCWMMSLPGGFKCILHMSERSLRGVLLQWVLTDPMATQIRWWWESLGKWEKARVTILKQAYIVI